MSSQVSRPLDLVHNNSDSSPPSSLADLHERIRTFILQLSNRIHTSLNTVIDALRVFRSLTFFQKAERIFGPRCMGVLWDYIREFLYLSLLAGLIPLECVQKRRSLGKELEMLTSIPTFLPWLEEEAPHAMKLGRAAKKGFVCSRNWVMECLDAFSSPSGMLGVTPSEAARVHKAEVAQGKWRTPPAIGKVRLHFYASLDKGRRRDDVYPKPDVRVDLDFDARHGLDLAAAKKALGVDNLAVISEIAPFRVVFDPATQVRLSPVAAYDLSNRFTRAIRVFEPRASKFTVATRKIREPTRLCAYFILTAFRSILGFSFDDFAYTAVTYGRGYAFAFLRISQTMRPVNLWAREGGWLLAQLVGFIALLPLIAAYQGSLVVNAMMFWLIQKFVLLLYVVSGATYALAAAVGTVLVTLVLVAAKLLIGTANNVITFFSSLSRGGWVAVLGACWVMAAEHHALFA